MEGEKGKGYCVYLLLILAWLMLLVGVFWYIASREEERKLKSEIIQGLSLIHIFAAVGCEQPTPVSDTVKWINTTYALLTEANHGDRDLIGGFKKTELNEEQVKACLLYTSFKA